jgi:hypothetical protein
LLNLLELSILLVGSLIEGVVIAFFLARWSAKWLSTFWGGRPN